MANGMPPQMGAPGGAPQGPPPEAGLPTGTNEAADQALNPVLEAFQTLQTFVSSQKEQGNPKADAMAQQLLGLIQSVGGGANLPPGSPGPEAPMPQKPAMAEGPRPEMAGKGSEPAIL